MTISSAPTRVIGTLSAGSTSTTFPFDYLDPANIEVYFDGVLKTFNSDYTINLQTITFTPALTAETVVSIISAQPYGDPLDFVNPEEWTANSVNQRYNNLGLEICQLRDSSVQVGPSQGPITVDDITMLIEQSEFNAAASALAASNSAINANASALLAQAWAESPTAVTPGHFSAKYWADLASAIVIPDNSIDTDMLQDGSVTNPKLATDAVTGNKIANSTITYDKFLDVFLSKEFPIDGSGIVNMQGYRLTSDNLYTVSLSISSSVPLVLVSGVPTAIYNLDLSPYGLVIGTITSNTNVLAGVATIAGRGTDQGRDAVSSISTDGSIINFSIPLPGATIGGNPDPLFMATINFRAKFSS